MDESVLIQQIPIGQMQNFTYVVGSASSREVALVDPAWNVEGLLRHVRDEGLIPKAVLITHYHQDHIGGALFGHRIEGLAELLELVSLPVYVHKAEAAGVAKVSGIAPSEITSVDSGDRLSLGEVELEFLHTPGHTPGSQCFRVGDYLVSGDTLFVQGCGRVDLPGSNPDDMFHSLRKLASLPDSTILLPGHDYGGSPQSELSDVKRQNVYLRMTSQESWRQLMGG